MDASGASSIDIKAETESAAGGCLSPKGGEAAGMPVESCTASSPGRGSSVVTVPANGSGRSPDSHIKAGDSRRKVKLCDHPVSLVTVVFQIAFPSGVG